MIIRTWKATGVVFVAGASMLLIAYIGGAGFEALGWMLALLVVVMAVLLITALPAGKTKGAVPNGLSLSEDLGQEMDLLVQQIEDSAKDMLGHVRKELSQMRSLVSDAIEVLQNSFNDLNHETGQQRKMVLEVLEKLRAAESSKSHVEEMLNSSGDFKQTLEGHNQELSQSGQRINDRIADAVRSLQFEDIVRQLTVSSEKHLDYLEEVLGVVHVGIRTLNSQHINVPEYIVGLHGIKAQIDKLEAECKAEAERSVSQNSMQKGEIELF
jgi:uncharacterized protein Yka (UPF0111/DUF47 family)